MKVDPKTMGLVREIARHVASVRIPAGSIRSHQRLPGERRSVHRGEGDDFDGHELYVYGDDPRTIDWNATAATGGQQVLIGLFKEETQLRNTIVCDVSPSMNLGSTRVTKRILAAELAACAVQSLSITHDPVGLITYSQSGRERRIKSGPPVSMMMPVILHILKSQATDRPGQHSGLAKALSLVPHSPSIVFVISDFINVTEFDWEALRRVGQRHRLFAMFVQDLRERELPKPGWLPMVYTVQDPSGNRRDIFVTRRSARAHAAKFQAHEAEILQRLDDCRARSITVVTNEGANATARVLDFLRAPVK
jgi:uncharacterized protein (DUF58 family)